jgi:hypothetical protein
MSGELTGEGEPTVMEFDGDGGSGGAPANGVGASGGVEDVNLRQEKISERWMQHQRERKGEDEPFTGDGSFTGGNGETEAAALVGKGAGM